MIQFFARLGATVAVCAFAAGIANAQWNPTRPVRYVVPYPSTSTSDPLLRLISARLNEQLGWTGVVDNQPGANGIRGAQIVAKAAPDGHTLITLVLSHVINPSLYSNLPYETLKSFTPVIRLASVPYVLTVSPALPVHSVKELLSLARARPGQLDYSSPSNGSPPHLATELLKTITGVSMTHIPYKEAGQAMADVIGGQVSMTFVGLAAAIPQIRAGKLRPLGLSSLTRVQQLPDVPTLDEAGVKGLEVVSWTGLAGPAGMPSEIVARFHDEISKIVTQPALKQRMDSLGILAFPAGPQEFGDYMATEQARFAEIVKKSGARID